MEKESPFWTFSQSLTSFPGQYFLQCEQEALNRLLPKFYGYYLVQAGIFNCYDLKSASTINVHIYLGNTHHEVGSNENFVESTFEELPFQTESIDVFFLPHTLELCKYPETLLNEIYNILIPDGKLIVIGFNPFSYIGLTKLLKSDKNLPWSGNLLSLGTLKRRLCDIGFVVEDYDYHYFSPPKKSKAKLRNFFESFGKRFFPVFGSFYILIAEKKTIPLSPLKLKIYNKKISVTHGFPEPSTNKGL